MSVDFKDQMQSLAGKVESIGGDILTARKNLQDVQEALNQAAQKVQGDLQREIVDEADRVLMAASKLLDAYNWNSDAAVRMRQSSQKA